MPGTVSRPAPSVGTAKYPESLCPRSVLPPLGRRDPPPPRTLLPVLRSYRLMRQSRWLSLPSVLHLVPGVSAGWYQPAAHAIFPTLSLQIFSPDAWSPTPTVPSSAFTCFFPDVSGLHQDTMGRLPVFIRECDFPAVI